jgi:hypothetical protein
VAAVGARRGTPVATEPSILKFMKGLVTTVAICTLFVPLLTACGVGSKPQAGSANAKASSRKGVDDARTRHVKCLEQKGIRGIHLYKTHSDPSFFVGAKDVGPTVIFLATAGAAQNQQIIGQAQGAEVIGSALVYPNRASDALMTVVEDCVAEGVSG